MSDTREQRPGGEVNADLLELAQAIVFLDGAFTPETLDKLVEDAREAIAKAKAVSR